tara:strand:+ start:355 stop:585 length:231 start_codon:yes stop_codon:yes gene_type:complete
MNKIYSNLGTIKKDYRNQLIHYYNRGIGKISEIAGVTITETLIKAVEGRYKQLGGILPISRNLIEKEKGKKWNLLG